MAHIQINHQPGGPVQIVINGTDYSNEIYRDFEIVEVGDNPETAEVGLRVTFAVSQLGVNAEDKVALTDHVPAVAARVRSIVEDVA